jgi:hypothetical protein
VGSHGRLLTGGRDVDRLPPELDTTVGHDDLRAALIFAGQVPAVQRLSARFQADLGRVGLVEILELHPGGPDRAALQPWVDQLTDDEVLERLDRVTHHRSAPVRLMAVLRELLAQAHRHTSAPTGEGASRDDRQ